MASSSNNNKQKNEAPPSILESIHNFLQPKVSKVAQNVPQYQRLICRDADYERKKRRDLRTELGKSKSGIAWGPTHSQDSDDILEDGVAGVAAASSGTDSSFKTGKDEPLSPQVASPMSRFNLIARSGACFSGFDGLFQSANEVVSNIIECQPCDQCRGSEDNGPGGANKENDLLATRTLGISPLIPPSKSIQLINQNSIANSSITHERLNSNEKTRTECGDNNARAAAKAMKAATHAPRIKTATSNLKSSTTTKILQKSHSIRKSTSTKTLNKSTGGETSLFKSIRTGDTTMNKMKEEASMKSTKSKEMSLTNIEYDADVPFDDSISELTMRSSHGAETAKVSETRRMAYYAVGKNHGSGDSPVGGNRRCYFSGKLVKCGRPFYAGSVQQGLRTLVVFCLPEAVGLPRKEHLDKMTSRFTDQRGSSHALVHYDSFVSNGITADSAFSEWAEDENGNLCENLKPNYLLASLPDPDDFLLEEMKTRYPKQYDTLPKQVRSPKCWRLFIKFCFFSGLPVADGEMYYKVIDKITSKFGKALYQTSGVDEVILSHEVMEAVNGSSAEILRLPNKKTFRYLEKHYSQQCAKLDKRVFERSSWEMVMPEI